MSALVDVHKVMRGRGDPVILELCRLRVAMLKRSPADLALRNEDAMRAGLDETKIAALRDWPWSPLYSPAEWACLALTEQFVMDVGAMTTELVDAVLEHLSPETATGSSTPSGCSKPCRACARRSASPPIQRRWR